MLLEHLPQPAIIVQGTWHTVLKDMTDSKALQLQTHSFQQRFNFFGMRRWA